MNFPILSSLIILPTIGAFFIFFVKSGNKLQIQNDKLKEQFIEKPLPMLDLSKWEKKDDSK